MANRIQVRRDTALNFTTSNIILAQGEPALEIDTLKEKIGDGVSDWNSLPYRFSGGGGGTGTDGKSAYQVAVDNGFIGTEIEWLESLKGTDGVDGVGTQGAKGDDGLSAYEIAVNGGFVGTETEWIASLKGEKGDTGGGGGTSSQEFTPYTALAQGNNEFVVEGTVLLRAGGVFGNGNPITYTVLSNSDQHGGSFITGVTGDAATNQLNFNYPTVKTVLNWEVKGDDQISANGIMMSATISTTRAAVSARYNTFVGFAVRGNGTTFSLRGEQSAFVTFSGINQISGWVHVSTLGTVWGALDFYNVAIVYNGPNRYTIDRLWSGIGSSYLVFRLLDTDGNPVINTTVDDNVIFSNFGRRVQSIGLNTYVAGVYTNNSVLLNNAIIARGVFEVWLKVNIVSNTSLRAKWQEKPAVTTYKLYRDTRKDLDTATLIYSGTNLQYLDTGLTPNTMYYYRLDDQADVEISRFWTKTRRTEHQN